MSLSMFEWHSVYLDTNDGLLHPCNNKLHVSGAVTYLACTDSVHANIFPVEVPFLQKMLLPMILEFCQRK